MKRAALGFVMLLIPFAGSPGMAADMPTGTPPPFYRDLSYVWTGFYIGINGGGAWGTSQQQVLSSPMTTTGPFDVSGGLVGGTIGFNMQVDYVVLGLEGDLDWARISGSAPCASPAFTCTTQNDYLGTTRLRLGYAFGPASQWLAYATAGAAFGDINQSFSPAVAGNAGVLTNRVGWTAGGGIQYAFLGTGWSVKLEYLYVDLGTFVCTTACSAVPKLTADTTLTENIFRAGVNYRF